MKISSFKYRSNKILLGFVLLLSIPFSLSAQDLEPRFLSPAPVGMNFVIFGYAYSVGNVLLGHSIPLEGTEVKMHGVSPAFARSINVFGLSGRISAALPLATATWYANLNGIDTSTTRTGFGDPVVAFAVNFIGKPALKGKEFFAYKQNTTVGASLKLRIPVGQYNSEKFFNLSTGRWEGSLTLGLSQKINRFFLEGYLKAQFFLKNNNFFGGSVVAQDPLFSLQIHGIYLFSPGLWAALSFGQTYGGSTEVDGVLTAESTQKNNRWGVTLALPISSQFAIKLAAASGISTRFGANFDTIIAALQYRWGGLE
jgi:hypothetical protein